MSSLIQRTTARNRRVTGHIFGRDELDGPGNVLQLGRRKLAQIEPAQERRFRATKKAWEWFQAQPKGYRTNAVYWMASAKKPETRERRLDMLIEDSARGRRVPPLRPRTGRR